MCIDLLLLIFNKLLVALIVYTGYFLMKIWFAPSILFVHGFPEFVGYRQLLFGAISWPCTLYELWLLFTRQFKAYLLWITIWISLDCKKYISVSSRLLLSNEKIWWVTAKCINRWEGSKKAGTMFKTNHRQFNVTNLCLNIIDDSQFPLTLISTNIKGSSVKIISEH